MKNNGFYHQKPQKKIGNYREYYLQPAFLGKATAYFRTIVRQFVHSILLEFISLLF